MHAADEWLVAGSQCQPNGNFSSRVDELGHVQRVSSPDASSDPHPLAVGGLHQSGPPRVSTKKHELHCDEQRCCHDGSWQLLCSPRQQKRNRRLESCAGFSSKPPKRLWLHTRRIRCEKQQQCHRGRPVTGHPARERERKRQSADTASKRRVQAQQGRGKTDWRGRIEM